MSFNTMLLPHWLQKKINVHPYKLEIRHIISLIGSANLLSEFRLFVVHKYLIQHQALTNVNRILYLLSQSNLLNPVSGWLNFNLVIRHPNIHVLANAIELLFSSGLLSSALGQHYLDMIAKHVSPDDASKALVYVKKNSLPDAPWTAICLTAVTPYKAVMVLTSINEQGIWSDQELERIQKAIISHENPFDFAKALQILADSNLLDSDLLSSNFESIATHESPYELAQIMVILNNAHLLDNEHGEANKVLIARHSNLPSLLKALCNLEKAGLLLDSQDNFNLTADHKNPGVMSDLLTLLDKTELLSNKAPANRRAIEKHSAPTILFNVFCTMLRNKMFEDADAAQAHFETLVSHENPEAMSLALLSLKDLDLLTSNRALFNGKILARKTTRPEPIIQAIQALVASGIATTVSIQKYYNAIIDHKTPLIIANIICYLSQAGLLAHSNSSIFVDAIINSEQVNEIHEALRHLYNAGMFVPPLAEFHFSSIITSECPMEYSASVVYTAMQIVSDATPFYFDENDENLSSEVKASFEVLQNNNLLTQEHAHLIKNHPQKQELLSALWSMNNAGLMIGDFGAENLRVVLMHRYPFKAAISLWSLSQLDLLKGATAQTSRLCISRSTPHQMQLLTDVLEEIHLHDLLIEPHRQAIFDVMIHHTSPWHVARALIILHNEGLLDGVSAEYNRLAVMQHRNPILIANALILLSRAGLLVGFNAQTYREKVLASSSPIELVKAFISLDELDLLSRENKNLISAHSNPTAAANALIALEKSQGRIPLNTWLFKKAISSHQEPTIIFKAIELLNDANLLSGLNACIYQSTVITHTNPLHLAAAIVQLHVQNLLTDANLWSNLHIIANTQDPLVAAKIILTLDHLEQLLGNGAQLWVYVNQLLMHPAPLDVSLILETLANTRLLVANSFSVNFELLMQHTSPVFLISTINQLTNIGVFSRSRAQLIFELILCHPNPSMLADAICVLDEAGLLVQDFGQNNLELLIKHQNSLSLAKAFVVLDRSKLLDDITRDTIKDHTNPLAAAQALEALNQVGLLRKSTVNNYHSRISAHDSPHAVVSLLKKLSGHTEPNTNQEDQERIFLIQELKKYIQRIESYKSESAEEINFAQGFVFFSQPRAEKRKLDYQHALHLLEELIFTTQPITTLYPYVQDKSTCSSALKTVFQKISDINQTQLERDNLTPQPS